MSGPLIRTRSSDPDKTFYGCKDCFLLFRGFYEAVVHFRTSGIHADQLYRTTQDWDDDESIDNAAATMVTVMMLVPLALPQPYSSGLKRKTPPAVVAAPVKKPRLKIDYENNRKIQTVMTGYSGAELTEAYQPINNGPAVTVTVDGSNLAKAAVRDLIYSDNRMIQDVLPSRVD